VHITRTDPKLLNVFIYRLLYYKDYKCIYCSISWPWTIGPSLLLSPGLFQINVTHTKSLNPLDWKFKTKNNGALFMLWQRLPRICCSACGQNKRAVNPLR